MLILGAVLEVHMYDVVFSLPFNMIGTVAISDVSDHVTKLVESEAQLEEGEGEGEEQDNEVISLVGIISGDQSVFLLSV